MIVFFVFFLQCERFFTAWSVFPNVASFSKCNSFLQCDPFFSVTHIILFDQFLQCDPFFHIWPTFHSVNHFSKSDPFFLFQMWPFFYSVTHVLHCDPFHSVTQFYSVTHFSPSDPYKLWSTFYSVIHFFTVRPIIHIVNHFIQCDSKGAFHSNKNCGNSGLGSEWNRHLPEFHSEILGVPRKAGLKFRKIGITRKFRSIRPFLLGPSFSEPGNRTQHSWYSSF